MLTLGVIGDYGIVSPKSSKIAELVKSWKPDVILTTGDNQYGGIPTIKSYASIAGTLYKEYITTADEIPIPVPTSKKNTTTNTLTLCSKHHTKTPCKTRFLPSVGNHDYPYEPYTTYFGLDTYYAVEFPNNLLKVISINNHRDLDGNVGQHSNSSNSPSIQRAWLEKQLTNSTHFKYIIIINHYPTRCSNNLDDENYQNQRRRFPYHEYKNIALVLSGHQHIYERLLVNNTTNIVIGTSGHSVRKMCCKELVLEESVYLDDSGYGALKLIIDENEIRGEYFVLDQMIRTNVGSSGNNTKIKTSSNDGAIRCTIKDTFVIRD